MTIGRVVKSHGKNLKFYDWGATPFYALRSEPRLSYCLYVPRNYVEDGDTRYPLVVAVHGTERGAYLYRDGLAEFAEQEKVIILAPLFPCNLTGPGDTENYKWLEAGGIRFDLALLDMVAEVTFRYRIAEGGFLLHGFSGGGHFVHRFLYAHPATIRAVSVGAPGVVTLCDETVDWPVGIRNMDNVFELPIDISSIIKVPVHCVVGEQDTEIWEITVPEGAEIWRAGMNETGRTRIDRLKTFALHLEGHGAKVQFDLYPDTGHDGMGVLPAVIRFFKDVLSDGVKG